MKETETLNDAKWWRNRFDCVHFQFMIIFTFITAADTVTVTVDSNVVVSDKNARWEISLRDCHVIHTN